MEQSSSKTNHSFGNFCHKEEWQEQSTGALLEEVRVASWLKEKAWYIYILTYKEKKFDGTFRPEM